MIRASTPGDVKFNIFSRINQGGLPLTAQEIRNAIFVGDWRKKVRDLAESTAFTEATEHKINGERMQDMELVLRFIAHYTFQKDRPDDQNLDEFLNETVEKRAPQWDDQYWENIDAAFHGALAAARRIFGKYAFRKYYQGWGRSPINRGLFETETVVLSRYTSHQIDTLAARNKEVYEKFLKLFADRDGDLNRALLYATGRGSSTNKRTKIIRSALDEVLNA